MSVMTKRQARLRRHRRRPGNVARTPHRPRHQVLRSNPALIPQGTQIATISVPAVLAVYDWPRSTDRYQRLERVVEYLFERFEKLQKEPGYHEKWKDVNLAASVPGWTRFKPLQDRICAELVGGDA